MKTKRGQKLCPECNTVNGVRSFECKQCNYKFNVKRKPKKIQAVTNWRELKHGQKIKVIGRSGPYYIDAEGMRHYWVESGCVYTVHGLDDNGIHAYPINGGGYTYLYMGPERQSKLTKCCYNAPHKLLVKNEGLSQLK